LVVVGAKLMFRFTIRDVLWLTVVVGLIAIEPFSVALRFGGR
jgi:hypothetical protein